MDETEIARAVRELKAACDATGLPRTTLARRADLSPNALRHMGSPNWDPTLSTLLALERAVAEWHLSYAASVAR